MDNYYDIFRMNMKYYRDLAGFSQNELAIQSDCTNGMIGQIESGKSKPSFDMILRLAKALNVHPSDLFLRDSSITKDKLTKNLSKIINKDLPALFNDSFGTDL